MSTTVPSGTESSPARGGGARNSSRSRRPVVPSSDARQTIVSLTLSAATGRPVVSVSGIPSSELPPSKTCLRCGSPKSKRGVLCRACWFDLRRQTVLVRCDQCGEGFSRQRHEQAKADRLGLRHAFCSTACRDRWMATNRRKRCRGCDAPLPKNTRTWCDACKEHRRLARAKFAPKQCPVCGETFQTTRSRQVNCSRSCANMAHSVRMRGKGNSHYRDGTSYSKWFKEMRPLIFERDGGCVVCRSSDSLIVHHVDEDPANNRPENLLTLCSTHHTIHHRSAETPWPWFATYAQDASRSTTSAWKARTTSLLTAYSSTTA